MKKLSLLVALLLLPALAFGGTTFTLTNASYFNGINAPRSQAVCTTGTETAYTLLLTDGLDLNGLTGFSVYVKSGVAFTAGGQLLAYIRNPVDGVWSRVSDGSLDLTLSAVTSQAFTGFQVQRGTQGRIAYLPSGAGGSNPITIDIVGAN